MSIRRQPHTCLSQWTVLVTRNKYQHKVNVHVRPQIDHAGSGFYTHSKCQRLHFIFTLDNHIFVFLFANVYENGAMFLLFTWKLSRIFPVRSGVISDCLYVLVNKIIIMATYRKLSLFKAMPILCILIATSRRIDNIFILIFISYLHYYFWRAQLYFNNFLFQIPKHKSPKYVKHQQKSQQKPMVQVVGGPPEVWTIPQYTIANSPELLTQTAGNDSISISDRPQDDIGLKAQSSINRKLTL